MKRIGWIIAIMVLMLGLGCASTALPPIDMGANIASAPMSPLAPQVTPTVGWSPGSLRGKGLGRGLTTSNGFGYNPTPGETTYVTPMAAATTAMDYRLGQDKYLGDPTVGATLPAALTAIGSTVCKLHVTAPQALSANLTVPSNITLAPDPGAIITIPTATTLTINGPFQAGLYQVFNCTGTGSVVFGYPSGIKELVPEWWGAKGDGINDDTTALNACIKCGIVSGCPVVSLRGAVYKTSDTIYIGSPTGQFVTLRLCGTTGGREGPGSATLIDASAFGDRPGVAVQGGFGVFLEHLCIVGKNIAPVTAGNAQPPDPVKADWITAGCVDSQYGPYCGVAVDPYAGTSVAGSYTNAPYGYGQSGSSGVYLKDVTIVNFVIGFCIDPNNSGSGGDTISLTDCYLGDCTYAYSGCGNNNDSINFYNTWAQRCWAGCVNNVHGTQLGHIPSFFGGGFEQCWKVFDASGGFPFIVSGAHIEGCNWLGNFGIGVETASAKFLACVLNINVGSSYEPYWFTGEAPVEFDSCYFHDEVGTAFNFFNYGQTTFNNNTVDGPPNIGGGNVVWGIGAFLAPFQGMLTYKASNNQIYVSGGEYQSFCLDNEYIGVSGFTRQPISLWTHTARLFESTGGFTNYHISLTAAVNGFEVGSGIPSVTVTGTDHNAVITFSPFNIADFAVNDVLFWSTKDRSGTLNVGVPALEVTNVNVGTGVVTAKSFLDNIDVTYNPGTIYMVVPLFINGTTATGSTHTNTTIDSVTNVSNFAVGDWIQGSGITTVTRITNIAGTVLTVSRATTVTAAGVSLYNCGLYAPTLTLH